MTDEQIVKALERCGNIGLCRDCPYYHFNSKRGLGCHNNLMLDALDLIKRQQAEIEELKADKEALINGQLTIQKMYIEARNKAVREFTERLKCESYQAANGGYISSDRVVSVADIDNLVREMTEEE